MDLSTLTVRSGKGDKDRTTILPATVKDPLKNHLIEVKSCMRVIFPGDMVKSIFPLDTYA